MGDQKGVRRRGRGFTLVELMIVVAILGILAVVAVPAFIKYLRRAKSVEAFDQLEKIYKASAIYYATPRVRPTSYERVPCAFPDTVAVTPTEGTCCQSLGGPDADSDDRCDSDPDVWTQASWNALLFHMQDSHWFVYEYVSSGQLAAATFTASAYGDLDCDGVQSTFRRAGFGDPQAALGECSIVGAAAYVMEGDTE